MKKNILIAGLLVLSSNVFAGDKGNGGDVVVCFEQKAIKIAEKAKADLKDGVYPYTPEIIKFIESVSLLDFYEYGNEAEMVHGSGNFKSILNERFEAINKTSFSYALELKDRYKRLQFDSYRSLPQVFDEKILPNLPANCLVAQVAIQNAKSSVVLVDSVLFSLMDETNKAGLMLHESLYNLAIELNQTDSYFTRRINNKIFNRNFTNFTSEEVFDLFSRSNMMIYRYKRYTTEFEGVLLPGLDHVGTLVNSFKLIDDLVLPRETRYHVNAGGNLYFTLARGASFTHGRRQIELPAETQIHFTIKGESILINSIIFPQNVVYGPYIIKGFYKLHENGSFEEVLLDQDYKGHNFFIPKATRIRLNQDLTLQDGTGVHLNASINDYDMYGDKINGYNLCQKTKFDKDQKLIECLVSALSWDFNSCVGKSCIYLKRVRRATINNSLEHQLASHMLIKLKDDKWDISFDGKLGVFLLNEGEKVSRWNWRSNHCQTGKIEFDGSSFNCY